MGSTSQATIYYRVANNQTPRYCMLTPESVNILIGRGLAGVLSHDDPVKRKAGPVTSSRITELYKKKHHGAARASLFLTPGGYTIYFSPQVIFPCDAYSRVGPERGDDLSRRLSRQKVTSSTHSKTTYRAHGTVHGKPASAERLVRKVGQLVADIHHLSEAFPLEIHSRRGQQCAIDLHLYT